MFPLENSETIINFFYKNKYTVDFLFPFILSSYIIYTLVYTHRLTPMYPFKILHLVFNNFIHLYNVL